MNHIYQQYYPFQSHYLNRHGLCYHYLDEGQGDPIIMVHGNPTWSFYYREVVKALRDTHRVIVPDHIGCGLSDKPDDTQYTYTLASRIDDLEALLDHLKLADNLTLLAHDWGGMIAMGYAIRHPQRIKRIILLNTAAFHLPKTKAMPWQLKMGRDSALGKYLILGLNAFARGATHMAVTRQRMPKALRDAYCAPYNSWSNRLATLRFVQDIPLQPGDPAWEIVSQSEYALASDAFRDIPRLLCWGMKDFVFDHHFLDQWLAYWPDAEVHRFDDCGHYVLEDASQQVIAIVQRFLQNHPLPQRTGP